MKIFKTKWLGSFCNESEVIFMNLYTMLCTDQKLYFARPKTKFLLSVYDYNLLFIVK